MVDSSDPSTPSSNGLFPDLPADLVPAIFGSLSMRDLYSLCLTCTSLRPLGQYLLYSTIHLEWQAWYQPRQPPNIAALARTLLDRPDLAAHVASLSLTGDLGDEPEPHYPEDLADQTRRRESSPADRAYAIEFVESTGFEFTNIWIKGLEEDHVQAYVAVVLSLLPNLKTLWLDEEFGMHLTLTSLVLKWACSYESRLGLDGLPFIRLQDVTITSFKQPPWREYLWARPDEIPENTLDVFSFLQLPHARSLRLTIENPDRGFTWPPLPQLATNITSLRLDWVREWHLCGFLAQTPALTKLDWGWYSRGDFKDIYWHEDELAEYGVGVDDLDRPGDIIDLDLIISAISTVKQTLTDLTIRLKVDARPTGGSYLLVDMRGSVRGLVDFPVLRTLEIPQPFMVGSRDQKIQCLSDVLGPSVEALVITDDIAGEHGIISAGYDNPRSEADLYCALESFLNADGEASPPTLKKFALKLECPRDHWGPTKQDDLRKLCESAGVELMLQISEEEDDLSQLYTSHSLA